MKNNIILIDAGLGTELTRLGFDMKSSKMWGGETIIENENLLKEAHLNFINNGSKIIETASYQLCIDNIMNKLQVSENDAKSVIKKSVEIAKDAISKSGKDDVLIAGSIGPYGACCNDMSEFDGSYIENISYQFLKEWHRPRLECLIEAGCDLIALETIPSLKEATVLIDLLSEYPQTKAWLSFSCKDDQHLSYAQDKFYEAFNTFKDNKQLIAIGINCTLSKFVTGLLKSAKDIQKSSNIPFIVYPNNGIHLKDKNNCFNSNEVIESICGLIPEWVELGAKYIGGCCDIDSRAIKKFNQVILNLNN